MNDNKYNSLCIKIEQLRDIYCGRNTYKNDAEWLDNVSHMMKELSDETGLAFESPTRYRSLTAYVEIPLPKGDEEEYHKNFIKDALEHIRSTWGYGSFHYFA